MKSLYKGNERGEIVLIILLVMAVGLTIGLAVASRSITDIRFSNQIEESSRAFSAAEAGIEEILKQGLVGSTSLSGTIGNASYNVELNSLTSNNSVYVFPTEIAAGDTQTVWLVGQKADGSGPDDSSRQYSPSSIIVCWSDTGSPDPAVEVSILFKSNSDGTYRVARGAYDPDSSRTGSNGFSTPDNGVDCGEITDFSAIVNFGGLDPLLPIGVTDIPIALRIRPVYADTQIGVFTTGGVTLPEQGKNIVSTGQTGSGVERRWNVVQTYAAPNDIFDYAVWSETDLSK